MITLVVLFSLFVAASTSTEIPSRQTNNIDPCAIIGGQKWVSPQDLRACYTSFAVDPVIKKNIIDTINKTLAFHTSVNYEISAPEPFTELVHEDLLKDLARISSQLYPSDYDLHVDLSRTLKRLNDGHCVWINSCYALFLNFLPIPLVLLTDSNGTQNVHIAPEAFAVASAEFPDEISVWQEALPPAVQLQSLDGAKVLFIEGQDPFVAVDANALITGSFQPLGTRQNSFFSSYQFGDNGWTYIMGDFSQQSLPLNDSVTLVVQRVNETTTYTIELPYRARIDSSTVTFTDSASYRANNCLPILGTNGVDLNETSDSAAPLSQTVMKFQQQPSISKTFTKERVNVMLDTMPLSDVALPPSLTPSVPVVSGGFGSGQFYMLPDQITGVFALGSFGGDTIDAMMSGMLEGLVNLKSLGATQLIVDVSNNGGGFICAAEFLHRIIVGPKNTTVPQAGLDTEARDGPLARLIVQEIIQNNVDPEQMLLYNPANWNNASNVAFATDQDWLLPPVDLTINGHADAFSQRLGQECQPNGFTTIPPDEGLFPASKVVIVSNGRCASSCSLFSITMVKEEGVRTVVLGGRSDVQQAYCGTVGGQSTVFSEIDTEIKTAKLKNNTLAPPDLLVNGVQGITWRLGFGIQDPTQPEEWQLHLATLNLLLTPDLVNNPVAIWTNITEQLLSDSS
ncbi:hypothetical protein J3R30DRAFT_3419502 [Lentinula aciculospora]|uniref:Tail specific protease domain-containing protein n=1 Tax=Lentinula aciculospora TaxID=153920 RepID=A0A9W9ATF9_9AGAR|nr:hypothetical protein J3R30DRAFT_3419502 [Lentinula aciculospora]